ncbi:hypothetical protein ACQY0O_000368 [Thecaphora frezii]
MSANPIPAAAHEHTTTAAAATKTTPSSASSSRSRSRKSKGDAAKSAKDPSTASATTTTSATASPSPHSKDAPALTADPATLSKSGGRRSRSKKEKDPNQQPKTKIRTKVVIRRLPPNVPEAVFWNSVAPWIRDAAQAKALNEAAKQDQDGANGQRDPTAAFEATVDYKSFLPGKLKADPNKENVCSRAYVRFLDPAMVLEFHKHYDGHVFRDSKGNESIAVVEFAPYQKVPTERRRKPDARQGTIEADAEYKAFLESLEAKQAEQAENKTDAELMAHLSQSDKEKDMSASKKSTPLLEHLRSLKSARAESSALAAAKSYKNPYAYQYPDDKPSTSSSKSALSKKSNKTKVNAAAAAATDGKKGEAKKATKKVELVDEAKASELEGATTVAVEKSGKRSKAAAVGGRAFGAALSGALGAAAPATAKAGKVAGKGKEKEKEKDKDKDRRKENEDITNPSVAAAAAAAGGKVGSSRSKPANAAEAAGSEAGTRSKTPESKSRSRRNLKPDAAASGDKKVGFTSQPVPVPTTTSAAPAPTSTTSSEADKKPSRRDRKPPKLTSIPHDSRTTVKPTIQPKPGVLILQRPSSTADGRKGEQGVKSQDEMKKQEKKVPTEKEKEREKEKGRRRKQKKGEGGSATAVEGKVQVGQAIWD